MRRAVSTAGFTLIELLLVLALVGLLASLGLSNFVAAQRSAQLQEAAAQFATDLHRARSAAQRDGQNAEVALGDESGAYTLSIGGQDRTRTLPHGVQVRSDNTQNSVAYTAPFGEMNATNKRFILTHRNGDTRVVKVIGVTGKVIVDE